MSETAVSGPVKAGRELDALVAEKVMGWVEKKTLGVWCVRIGHPRQEYETTGWASRASEECNCSPGSDGCDERHQEHCATRSNPYGGISWKGVFNPSTSIAAAWEVVEKLKERFPTFHLSLGAPNNLWYCSFFGSVEDRGAALEAETPAHAICLAALKAVEDSP